MRALLMALAALALLPASAQAVELGVSDDGRSSADVAIATSQIGGTWTRTIAYVGQPGVAQRIRDAHKAGQKIILTVGGTGTQTRKPSAREALAYIRSLPRADRYTVWNEPDLSGIQPCTYMRRWKTIRRALGTKLLYGDFSPHMPITYTAAARKCGTLPSELDVALHPYQPNDPFKRTTEPRWEEGSFGNLTHAKRIFRGMGARVRWWLTELGYRASQDDKYNAWLWPRAIARAKQLKAKVLIAYTAQGSTWDTRPRPIAWCAMTRGRSCPKPEEPRNLEVAQDHGRPVVSIAGGDGSTASTVAPDPNPPTTDLHSTDGEGTNLGESVTTTAQTTDDGLQSGPQPEAPNDGSGDSGST